MFNDDTPITLSYLRKFIPEHASRALNSNYNLKTIRIVAGALQKKFGRKVRINKKTQANIIQAVKELKLRRFLESK